jgi:hypothetical protein
MVVWHVIRRQGREASCRHDGTQLNDGNPTFNIHFLYEEILQLLNVTQLLRITSRLSGSKVPYCVNRKPFWDSKETHDGEHEKQR